MEKLFENLENKKLVIKFNSKQNVESFIDYLNKFSSTTIELYKKIVKSALQNRDNLFPHYFYCENKGYSLSSSFSNLVPKNREIIEF